ncbi:hypothetical protein J3458_001796 [Metarhizium acridum]|uniref:uncharacterized protein n=1 Tax=Metarhizium acridum TaxID=92637 RepID=UPI001C6B3A9D|nr:hypothetical protein J3458_001796 [Metarhizium acridum]
MQLVSHLMVLLAVGTSARCEPATSIMGVSYRSGGGGCPRQNQYLGHFAKDLIISGKCVDVAHAGSINFGTVDGWCWGYKTRNCEGLKKEMNFTLGCNKLSYHGSPRSVLCRLPVY